MKKYLCLSAIAAILVAIAVVSVAAQWRTLPNDINWQEFLQKHDFVYEKFPQDYYSGVIMGNGLLGCNLYKDGSAYKFHIGRVDITEGRMPANKAKYANLYDGARLPIGYFLLKPNGSIQSDGARLRLYDAEMSGRINTSKGTISLRSYVHHTKNVIVVETVTEGSENGYDWEWQPLRAISPRYAFGKNDYPDEYGDHKNSAARVYDEEGYHLSIQNLVGGTTYVVAWTDERNGSVRSIVISIEQDSSEAIAVHKAKAAIDGATDLYAGVKDQHIHRQKWHDYYNASFASFENAAMEAFYWRQMYKFACLTREDGYIIDLQGPWAVQKTPWPAIWMNLNVQLTYSPLFTANRAALSKPLWKALNDNLPNLIENVYIEEWKQDAAAIGRSTSYHLYSPLKPDGENPMLYETGNLTWIMFYYYQYCIYQQDEEELLQRFYPLLKRSIAYYRHIREQRSDGKYHLPQTASPEYKTAKDCNYDLALLRWGLNTLLSLNEKYKLNDANEEVWRDFINNLTDYPKDTRQGFMIGEDVKLTESHRHYSHLLMIYPLYAVNYEQAENRALIDSSVAHWQSMPQYLQGYSFTGSASMYAMMGNGERAKAQLQKLLDKFIQPNTLYKETGPVIETPLAGAASLQELYLQSWGGIIRVFPAVPQAWQKARFIRFRAEGAFLVSATREGGKTTFIQVESEQGGVCRLLSAMNTDAVTATNTDGGSVEFSVIDKTTGLIEINMQKGDVVQISAK